MSSDINKKVDKCCKICDCQLYETDVKPFEKLYKGFTIKVYAYADYVMSMEICHGCLMEAVYKGEIK